MEVQLAVPRENFARIVEQRAVQSRKDLPAVFAVHHECIPVVEAPEAESAQIVLSTEDRLHVKRNDLSRVSQLSSALARGDDTSSIREWNVLLRFQRQPP
jgi:hypothetical protein